jgi:hypothetical protein
MFNPKAFLLFLTVVAALALAVEATQGTVNVWWGIGGAVAVVAIELVMTLGPAFQSHRQS